MERIALASSPCAASPDDTFMVGSIVAHSLPECFVVAQGIEVVLIESCFAAGIDAIVWCSLTEVTLDSADSLFDEVSDFALIPCYGLGIAEVEHRIFIAQCSVAVVYSHAAINEFTEVAVLRCEVGQLPETGMETVFLHRLEHGYWIFETIFGKLIVALPIYAKPSCIEMDNI